jgi:hypothetical protein
LWYDMGAFRLLTSRTIVADCEPTWHAEQSASFAVLRCTSDTSGALPNNLREMAPGFEIAHIRVVLAVSRGWEKVDFAIVPHVRDSLSGDGAWRDATGVVGATRSSNVLAITTSTWGPIGHE